MYVTVIRRAAKTIRSIACNAASDMYLSIHHVTEGRSEQGIEMENIYKLTELISSLVLIA